ncbi:hypothetical protein GYMLUDRAFT_247564 [Collybiopsis luxurians FD-317 M1]|uniref:Uncharacterized protein n=1 Tax=Collybiopsis luxurians FD-317 M1 TaxID=944289 RepID=A0A0D0C353_9AGAR|nr:hypothetical protein GYMLUDRAFT_247564 [Collybiopsis luxurians FD-317 M1]
MDVLLETPSIVPLAPANTPSTLDTWANELPTPLPGTLPCTIVKATVNDTPLTYALIEKSEEELAKPELHMTLGMQDICKKMQINRAEDLYNSDLEEIFEISSDEYLKYPEYNNSINYSNESA